MKEQLDSTRISRQAMYQVEFSTLLLVPRSSIAAKVDIPTSRIPSSIPKYSARLPVDPSLHQGELVSSGEIKSVKPRPSMG